MPLMAESEQHATEKIKSEERESSRTIRKKWRLFSLFLNFCFFLTNTCKPVKDML